MAFLNIPLKSIQANLSSVVGISTMPWYNPIEFPVLPGNPAPLPIQKDYRWRIVLDITTQTQSSILSREPGIYNGIDVVIGQWIANVTTGQAWQIITVESKSRTSATCIIQDVYRYNTFRDVSGGGNGGPGLGTYVIFCIGETGVPEIDPVPPSGVSSNFGINIQSRFQYINLQFDYPLYQPNNNFAIDDIIAVDSTTHSFVKSSDQNRITIGRVTSISDTILGWFTINPAQKINDYLNYLPGGVGDIIYTDLAIPGALTVTPGGSQVYVKLRDNTSSISVSTVKNGNTTVGNVFQLNGEDITVGGTGNLTNIVTASNLKSTQTGVSASLILSPTTVETNISYVSGTYGEVVLWASSSPAVSTINDVSITFNVTSTEPGYEDYARPAQMAQVINAANIPNIIAAATSSGTKLQITNTSGGVITITNTTPDVNGVTFAGTSSASGLVLSTIASTTRQIKFIAVDARAINFLDVVGNTVDDIGLVSVENGVKACGLYIEEGLRQASSTVVSDLTQLHSLSPFVGDQAYVINSDDGNGNNVGEWSLWIFDGSSWIETSNQDSATTDAKSLEYTLTIGSPSSINIGTISTGRRIALITVEVTTPFNGAATLDIGYQVQNPTLPPPVPTGLMTSSLIDLTVVGTYSTSKDILFGIDTPQGDITVTAKYVANGSTVGSAQIIVSYV